MENTKKKVDKKLKGAFPPWEEPPQAVMKNIFPFTVRATNLANTHLTNAKGMP